MAGGLSHHSQEGPHDEHHVVEFATYLKVLLILLFLTFVTVAAAQVDLGHTVNTIIAIGIASVKAGLVMAVFMQLWWDERVNLMLVFVSVAFLILLFAFSAIDIFTRPGIQSTL